mgnify:CR=1 FL=1
MHSAGVFGPGGQGDITARAIADNLPARLGQPVVVEFRTGAGGSLGAEMAARSAPDGYTTSFILSQIRRIAAMISLSLTVRMSRAYWRKMPKVRSLKEARRPSAMVEGL